MISRLTFLVLVLIAVFLAHESTAVPADLNGDLNARNQVLYRFQQYLRLPTQHPKPNYEEAIRFLLGYVNDFLIGPTNPRGGPLRTVTVNDYLQHHENQLFKCTIFRSDNLTPNFILTVKGRNPSKGSILVSSHMDVVPADPDHWTYPPFNATLVTDDTTGKRRIYSRGTQDMKCVGAAYLEAVMALFIDGWQPDRNLHILFVADEEIGGKNGWGALVSERHSLLWKELNVVFGLDEGIASGEGEDVVPIFYGEKVNWWFEVTVSGNVGHGSQFIKDTATEKLSKMLSDKIFPFRQQQEIQMKLKTTNPKQKTKSSSVITINLTGLKSGHVNENGQFTNPNVIPGTAVAFFDMRLPPGIDYQEVDRLVHEWVDYVNGSVNFVHQIKENPLTDLNDEFVKQFLGIINEDMKTETVIVFAGTDARYPRNAGVNTLGYSYLPRTKILLHDHDEYIDEDVYLKSIEYYMKIFTKMLQ